MSFIYRENDNINQEAINEYMKLSDAELDKMLEEEIRASKKQNN